GEGRRALPGVVLRERRAHVATRSSATRRVARARRRLTSVRDLGSVATGTLLALIVAGGAVLRWAHLRRASLWGDEIVDLAMAQAGGVADVIHAVRHGVPVGSGNAGAMPLDYLLLHAWLAATPPPSPEHLEGHVRLAAVRLW